MKKLCVVNELNGGNNGTNKKIRIQPNNGNNCIDMGSSMGYSDDSASDTETIASNTENSAQKRKRQRLTHLSVDEKLLRRKLKNRVAAQSARDRKKVS